MGNKSPKTNVYIDVFNLYFGALKESRHKWLNLAEFCRKLLPRKVGVINPQLHGHPSKPLIQNATFFRQLRASILASCQFPSPLTDATGTFHKPPSW
ncbi:MAG: hypothetical protein AUJ52_13795 [Elusimicrobia bacterium CG1_02_63_36]|nr:MAG: hypothetical protein AUJ52_13795 [Elusimicrobia bacterium CG1_02_63_36]PJA17660.1 MAG: hypothetical protein COX66_03710 [Elusimicrobia bacterium CG_4_10_14_0_2_um_filter_63_34]PJB25116.1 MAG: hypothetical protein CO113_10260 [Elusimicrobia bacterium CG_4_9_14_3_um_filter_62_55]